MRSYRSLVLAFAVAISLAACAFTPQQIQLNPNVEVKGQPYGQGQRFSIATIDNRASASLGSRGGVYQDSSVITVGNDLEAAVTDAFVRAMTAYGFVFDQGASGAMEISVFIDDLSYSSPDALYANKVDMSMTLRVEVISGTSTWSNRYVSRGEKRFVMAPGKTQNEAQLNALVSSTLGRVFVDPGFVAFVASHRGGD